MVVISVQIIVGKDRGVAKMMSESDLRRE